MLPFITVGTGRGTEPISGWATWINYRREHWMWAAHLRRLRSGVMRSLEPDSWKVQISMPIHFPHGNVMRFT